MAEIVSIGSGDEPDKQQTLPQNIEAEAALLGALMIDNRLVEDVQMKLRTEHFFEPLHGRVYEQIMAEGWHEGRAAFVQHYGTDVLDASLLLMPLMGFVAPRDPMWTSTLEAMDEELVSDSLVYRYNPSASPDGP